MERQTAAEPGVGSGSLLDAGTLREIVEILKAANVEHLTWSRGEERLVLRMSGGPSHAAPVVTMSAPAAPVLVAPVAMPRAVEVPVSPSAVAAAPAPAPVKPGQVISSPFVGTFYRSPAPDQSPFVEVGSIVRKGQVLCIVEAMKLMNEIESEIAGRVAEIFIESGQPVEFGQALFRIEPV